MGIRKPLIVAGGQLQELPATDYVSLPSLAISVGDQTPDPGGSPVVVWSTVEKMLLAWNGASWQQLSITHGQALALARGMSMP